MRLWIGLALIAICAGTNLADYDLKWYDSSPEYEYPVSAENSDDNLNLAKELPADGNENDEKNNDNIKNLDESLENAEDKSDESVLNDYQFEDNRSEPEDEQNVVPQDEQKYIIASTVYNEKPSEQDVNYKVNPEINGLGDEIDANYNIPPDTHQFDDGNRYDMDENSIMKPLDNENQNTLTENVSEAEEDDENIVNDTLNMVFDDAENAEKIQETIESIEQSNQIVKDFAADIAEQENVFQDNTGDEQSEEIQREAASEHEIEPLSFRGDFDEFQQPIIQDTDDQKLDKEILESHEYDDYEPIAEDESDTNEAFKEQEQISHRDIQNEDENSKEQIVEENINNESESNDDKNEEIANESEQYVDENQAPNNENFIESNDERDSKEDAVDDLDDDLKQLFEIWNKLQDNDTIKENDDENKEVEDDWSIRDYEEKYNKPYRESNILSAREYTDETDGIDNDVEDLSEQEREMNNDDETDEERKDDFKSNATSVLQNSNEKEDFVENDESFYRNSPLDKNNLLQNYDQMDEIINEDSVVLPTISEKSSEKEGKDEIFYRSGSSIAQLNETKEFDIEDETEKPTETVTEYYEEKSTAKAIDVDDLTPDQYDDLMKQFSVVHSEDLEIKSGDYVAPIHFTLSADEAVVVESPDYPDNYPTNNVIDYYFDGLGTGIEFNITEFSVNGVLGDYLLVKPGGIDASGTDGLVLSYHLNEKRLYRFLNVDRLFVRFFAHPGVAMFKGYQFSVKMISPPEEEDDVLPEPEPLLPPPATHSVALGGTSLQDFEDIKEDFRRIIADMATMYINANNIELGLNSTSETTQITKTSLCNVNWPSFESCVAVTFGVPLEYGDDDDGDERPARLNETDLRTMWDTYVSRDPFATRLRIMGITEFDAPNDRRVLTVWLVIAAGVVISMAMLAFALWRFSCFEDYTRMAAYSDTDSINEKRVLDMYPTPHQTFPAMYSEQQLKWDDDKFDDTSRVDMGGFANRSYVRDDAMDMDSDDDIITAPRDRNNSFSPRDIYQV